MSLSVALKASGQDFSELLRDFDSRSLSYEDKRFLQTALAFEGHYNGLLDGDWGRMSQAAMTRYSWSEFDGPTEDWHMAAVAFDFFDLSRRDGWQIEYFANLELSFLVPQDAVIIDEPSADFFNFHHAFSSLSYSTGIHSVQTVNRIHSYTLSLHQSRIEPYLVRNPSRAITSSTASDGSILYTRSDKVRGAWRTIMISASRKDKALLGAVSSSIAPGYTPPIQISKGGRLEHALKVTIDFLQEQEEGAPPTVAANPSPPKSTQPTKRNGSSGSGFVVSSLGHVLTNEHVISGCTTFTVDKAPAELVGSSEVFDLALLRFRLPNGKKVAEFSPAPARLNSDVTAVGFPYAGILGGLNVTRGAVSSLSGLGNDGTRIQISAPVQAGNSGGPLVGPDGEVVGVVVSKLDAQFFSEKLGDTPQNVNFAVRGEVAKMFLSQHGIEPVIGEKDDVIPNVDLAESAKKFTVFVECR